MFPFECNSISDSLTLYVRTRYIVGRPRVQCACACVHRRYRRGAGREGGPAAPNFVGDGPRAGRTRRLCHQ